MDARVLAVGVMDAGMGCKVSPHRFRTYPTSGCEAQRAALSAGATRRTPSDAGLYRQDGAESGRPRGPSGEPNLDGLSK